MPDGYAHRYNGICAMNIAQYKPRDYRAFIMGCNGPDPLYFYQMYNPWRKMSLQDLGHRMHTEKHPLEPFLPQHRRPGLPAHRGL